MAKIIPVDDRIIVKRIEPEKVSRGGIYIPDEAQEKPNRGKVVGVGPGKLAENGALIQALMNIAKGDEIIFASYTGVTVEFEGEQLILMSRGDVLAVIK